MATKRLTIKLDDFSGGWAGDVDRSRAKKGQWFGQDVMLYTDGLLGPRHPIRKIPITSPPALAGTPPRVDEGLLFERVGGVSSGAFVLSGTNAYFYLSAIADLTTPRTITTVAMGGKDGAPVLAMLETAVFATIDTGASRMVKVGFPGGGTVAFVLNAGAPDPVNVFVRWLERMVYAINDKIGYSDANAFATWPAANIQAVGDGSKITALVPAPLALYVAKQSGWFVVTGVLGSTATTKQVWERGGVEPAQQAGTAVVPAFGKPGVRTVAAWDRGMLWLRRRANDGESDLPTTTTAVENSELMSFTGAQMEQIATIRTSRQARLQVLPRGAAVLDCQNAPVASAVQHVAYVVNADKTLSRHIFPAAYISTQDQVVCPLQPAEGANHENPGYDGDHLQFAYANNAGNLEVAMWRFRASRPGYGSDDPAQQASTTNGGQANIVGVVEFPDWWDTEGRQIKVQTVHVSGRKYDNSTAAGFVSTARLRAQATLLGRIDQTGDDTNNPSAVVTGLQEVIGIGAGDQDFYCAVNVNDGGWGCGFRLRLELEMCSIRSVWVQLETGDLVK